MAKKDPYLRSLGERIARLRKAAYLSQQELAEKAGLSVKGVSEMERGVVNPSIMILRAVAAGLGVDLHRLIAEPGNLTRELEAALFGKSRVEQARALAVLKAMFASSDDLGS